MILSLDLPDNIQWPIIIQLYGDDELIYIAAAQQMQSDKTLHQMQFQPQDKVIDSHGSIYDISKTPSLTLTSTGRRLILPQIEDLLRLHLSSHGNCCVAKFHASSVADAINSVFA